MTTKKMTTEAMVRRCFCKGCVTDDYCDYCDFSDWQKLSAAARRFVRTENRQKRRIWVERVHAIVKQDHPEFVPTKLPKHWGEVK